MMRRNIPELTNRSGRRVQCPAASDEAPPSMNRQFRQLVESLEPKYQALVTMPPVRFVSLPKTIPVRGIYRFSEGDLHLYVGRTNGIRKRLQDHCRLSGSHFTATFAFRIARHSTGQTKASYAPEGSRARLCENPTFASAFAVAK